MLSEEEIEVLVSESDARIDCWKAESWRQELRGIADKVQTRLLKALAGTPDEALLLTDVEIRIAEETGDKLFSDAFREYRIGRANHPKPRIDFEKKAITQAQLAKVDPVYRAKIEAAYYEGLNKQIDIHVEKAVETARKEGYKQGVDHQNEFNRQDIEAARKDEREKIKAIIRVTGYTGIFARQEWQAYLKKSGINTEDTGPYGPISQREKRQEK